MSITELAKYIRFQLGELRAQNKHHEFEHLARQFARLRICENILPATGPVGAGGDKGRDFETYRTYLASTPIATSTFLGLAKDKKLVFSCSLQQDIAQKVKSDVPLKPGHQRFRVQPGMFPCTILEVVAFFLLGDLLRRNSKLHSQFVCLHIRPLGVAESGSRHRLQLACGASINADLTRYHGSN